MRTERHARDRFHVLEFRTRPGLVSAAVDIVLDLWQGAHPDHWGAQTWGRPERVVPGVSRQCWGNARRAAAADPGLAYAEGVVRREGRVAELHGWCLDCATGGVVEVTGPDYADAVAYRGVILGSDAVEDFLDDHERRERWGIVDMLGDTYAEPPSVLFILMDELNRGARTQMETWAVWRELRRSAPARSVPDVRGRQVEAAQQWEGPLGGRT